MGARDSDANTNGSRLSDVPGEQQLPEWDVRLLRAIPVPGASRDPKLNRMALGTIELLEAEVQRAEDQLHEGNAKLALDSYCAIFQDRWWGLGSRADLLTAADLTVLERIAEISIPFGFTAQADKLFAAAANGYLRLGSRYWFDYVTLKRVHMAFSNNAVFDARELLKTMRPSLGDLESLSLDSDSLALLETQYTATRDLLQRQALFANLYLQLGRLAIALGSYAGAVAAAQRGLEYAGTHAPLNARSAHLPLRLMLARAQIGRGNFTAALEELRNVRGEIKERSQSGLLCMWLEISAQLSMLRGDFGAAQDYLTQVWRMCLAQEFLPPALRAFLNLAQLLIVLNKTVEAKRLLEAVETHAHAIGEPTIETDAARLRLVAEARAQRDPSGPDSVSKAQGGHEEPEPEVRLNPTAEFRVRTDGFSLEDFQLRALQVQFYLGNGRVEAAKNSLQRLQSFANSDSRLVQLGLEAMRATDLYFGHRTNEALALLRKIAAAYGELGMLPDQWRAQVLWKRCLEQLGSPASERVALAIENERLLATMAGSLSIEERIVFLLNKPTELEEQLARKIRELQDLPASQNGLYGRLLYLYRQARTLNSILDDVYWQREATAEIRLNPKAASARTPPVTP